MTPFRQAVHNVFVWSYGRGTLQYDVICILILAFVFLVPPGCFVAKKASGAGLSKPEPAVQSRRAEDGGQK